jgi:hypothetical protein
MACTVAAAYVSLMMQESVEMPLKDLVPDRGLLLTFSTIWEALELNGFELDHIQRLQDFDLSSQLT